MTAVQTGTDWVATYRRKRSRMGDPLRGRRVRLEDGREGTVSRAGFTHHGRGSEAYREDVFIGVILDEKKRITYGKDESKGYWTNATWTGDLSAVELLDPPLLATPVRVRRVLARGGKEQIAERWAALQPLTDEQREAGYDRYVEFQPDVAAYRRWRIVSISPPMEQEKVDALPSEHPRAVAERSNRADSSYDEGPASYGF